MYHKRDKSKVRKDIWWIVSIVSIVLLVWSVGMIILGDYYV